MDSAEMIAQSRRHFLAVITLPMIATSTVGNCLSYLLLQLSKQVTSTSYYLRALAVADTLTVHTLCWRYFIIGVANIDIFAQTDAGCKAQMFVNYIVSDVAIWLVPCVSVDRVLALYLPLRSRQLCTRKVALIVMAGLVVLALAKNVILLVGLQVNYVTVNGTVVDQYCWAGPEMLPAWSVRNAIAFATVACVPAGVTIVMNCLLFVGINRRFVASSSGGDSEQEQALKNSIRLTLAISVAFLVFLVPFFTFLNIRPTLPQLTAADDAKQEFIQTGLEMFFYLNHTVNFIMYIIASPSYRREMRKIICGRFTQISPL